MTPTPPKHDPSNGWDGIADEFVAARDMSSIGVDVVREWARNLRPGVAILDLGCGSGVPISHALAEDGFRIHGVDASPTLVAEFKRRLPRMSVVCEPAETSTFHGRTFDGIIAVGLVFLLPADTQERLISRMASALNPGGHLLFTSPAQACEWVDLMTGRESRSIGEDAYVRCVSHAGLTLVGQCLDEGGNCYFHASKPRLPTP